jgi:hypothetical protein
MQFTIPLQKGRSGPGASEDFLASSIMWLDSIVNFITTVTKALSLELYTKTNKK